ncbi:MAG: DDE-type integrase/transposase/recombinase, partial [Culicoidibacterales bacterium]
VMDKHLIYSRNNHLLLIHKDGGCRICVPKSGDIRIHILYHFHDKPTAGHLGAKKTLKELSMEFYWPRMTVDVQQYVASCLRCQSAKSLCQKPAGLLQPIETPTRRWESISMDFIVALPRTNNDNDCIFTVVDRVSKMAHFIPIQTTANAEKLAEVFTAQILRLHGIPKVIISDRDTRFTSEFWIAFCNDIGTKRHLSTAFHPQTDGQTERVHRTIEQMLRCQISADETQWESILPLLEFAYNCTTHSSTKMSPFEVMIGEKPLRPIDIQLNLEALAPPNMRDISKMFIRRAISNIHQAQKNQKKYADKSRRETTFEVEDKVLLSSSNLSRDGSCKAFKQRFIGPFSISEKIGKVAYRLALPPHMIIHNVFHVSQLKKFIAPNPERRIQQPYDPVNIDGLEEYEMEAILQHRGPIEEPTEYLVKFKGYDEPEWTLPTSMEHGKTYISNYKKHIGRATRGRRFQKQGGYCSASTTS